MADQEPQGMTEHDRKTWVSGQSLGYDTFKHLTTLSTGSLLLLVGLLEKLFQSPTWRLLVPLTLLGLTVSIITSLYTMFVISTKIRDASFEIPGRDSPVVPTRTIGVLEILLVGPVMAAASFLFAMICLVLFFLANYLA